MKSGSEILLWLVIWLFSAFSTAEAQGLRQDIHVSASNRPQFDQILVGEHFDIYHQSGIDSLANKTLNIASDVTMRIEKLLGYRLSGKIRIFLHPDPGYYLYHLNQEQIRNKYQTNSGGNTLIPQNEFDLIYEGSIHGLTEDIASGICKVLLFEMLYGGTVQEKIKYASLLQLPDWFIPGLCAYVASKWTTEDDHTMRLIMLNNRRIQLNNLSSREQAVAGKSLWMYMALVKGESSFQRILYLVRLTRKLENATYFVFNWNIQQLIKNWHQFYVGVYSRDLKRRLPQSPEPLMHRNSEIVNLIAAGDAFYLLVLQKHRYRLIYYPIGGEYEEIYRTSRLPSDRSLSLEPLLSPLGEQEVVWIMRHENYSECIHFKGKTLEQRYELKNRGFITEFEAGPNLGKSFISVLRRGIPYLEVMDLSRDELLQEYRLPYLISDFSYDPETRNLLFAAKSEQSGKFDVYQWDTDSNFNQRINLTLSPDVSEIQPHVYKSNQISFLSDINGIYNSFVLNPDDRKLSGLTDYQFNISRAVYNRKTGQVAEVLQSENQQNWYISEADTFSSIRSLNRIPTATYFKEKPAEREITVIQEDSAKWVNDTQQVVIFFQTDFPENVEFADPDTFIDDFKDNGFNPFVMPYHSFLVPKLLITQLDNGWINTYYSPTYAQPEEILYIPLGINVALKLSEVSQKYHLTLGGKVARNFNQFDYSVEFDWLKSKFPVKAEFFRQSKRHFRTAAGYHKITSDYFSVGTIFPINKFNQVGVNFSDRFDMHQYLSTEISSLSRTPLSRNYVGAGFYWINDQSYSFKPGLYQGVRIRGYGQQYFNTSNGKHMFYAGLDARYGLKLFKNAFWMNRFQAESSMGKERVTYLLGAQENWLFPEFKSTNALVQTPGFYRMASPLRGFPYNVRNGHAFAALNSEVRYRPLGHLLMWNTRSEMLEHMLLVAFTDVGTAWYGASPFDLKSPLNSSTIQSGSMVITRYNRKQPFVYGFGYGLRTSLFGYYLKFDKAWGRQDAKWQTPMTYITLGRDF